MICVYGCALITIPFYLHLLILEDHCVSFLDCLTFYPVGETIVNPVRGGGDLALPVDLEGDASPHTAGSTQPPADGGAASEPTRSPSGRGRGVVP